MPRRMQRKDQRFWSRVAEDSKQANSGCFNKASHPSKRQAAAEAQRMSDHLGELMQEYKCKHCGRWHIGHYSANHKRRPYEQSAPRF